MLPPCKERATGGPCAYSWVSPVYENLRERKPRERALADPQQPETIAGGDRALLIVRELCLLHRVHQPAPDGSIVDDRPVTAGHDAIGAEQLRRYLDQRRVNELRVDEDVPAKQIKGCRCCSALR